MRTITKATLQTLCAYGFVQLSKRVFDRAGWSIETYNTFMLIVVGLLLIPLILRSVRMSKLK